MCAPLFDDKGKVRYFIGAQVDVTGLVENGAGVESFRAFLQKDSQKIKKVQKPKVVHSMALSETRTPGKRANLKRHW
jgi:hypothetical protein